jgi:UDPglucose 6-dehydrogenase
VRLAVFGAGRVGVPTAASLASTGHQVAVTDTNLDRLDRLGRGIVPFHEPGLDDLVRRGLEEGRLRFVADPAEAATETEAAFVCVGTPTTPEGATDLEAVEGAAEAIGRAATSPIIVVVKSTVPPGTGDRVAALLDRLGVEAAVVSNPEFLREGKAVEDSIRPLRVLVGTDGPEAAATMRRMYRPLIEDGVPYVETDRRTAELAKHACNAFLALKVSYMNALARVCETAGGDVTVVAETMGVDPRIGPAYLAAGLGYGGYCLPKDLRAFEWAAGEFGYQFGLLHEVERINQEAVEAVLRKIHRALGAVAGARVALLGLAFKPGTDNVTAAPALTLARRLLEDGAVVAGYDPQAGAHAKSELPEMEVAGDPYGTLEGADCAVICTEWPEFLELDLDRARALMRTPVLVDGRNQLDPDTVAAAGFTYLPTGRPPAGTAQA